MDNPPISDEFEIISSVRSDGTLVYSQENTLVNATMASTLARSPTQFYMLNYHRERMLIAAEAFGWNSSPLEGPKAFTKLQQMLHDHLGREYNDKNYAAPLKVW